MSEQPGNVTDGDPTLVAKCGLYCGQCGSLKRGRCGGCAANEKATWCKVRTCCIESGYDTCAECVEFDQPMACRKYNNLISRIFGFIFRSDRAACIARIRRDGIQKYAETMQSDGRHSIRRGYSRP